MSFDFQHHLGATERRVVALERDGKPARAVTLSRVYDTDAADLWDAIVDPERLKRWFLPVSGELKVGGRYQLTGNAGRTITGCEPPHRLALTWEFGPEVSWVNVTLADEAGGKARLTLEHIAPVSEHWTTYGPGAVGVGWELGLAALEAYLADPAMTMSEAELSASAEGKAFIRGAAEAWGRADIAAGADSAQAIAAAKATGAFYTGESPPG